MTIYPSKFGVGIKVAKGDLLEHIRGCLEKKLNQGSKVLFYGKPECKTMIVFPITKTINGEKMFPVNDCGVRETVALSDLEERENPYKIVGVLKSGKITKKPGSKNEYIWKVLLKEIKLSTLSKEEEKYFVRDDPVSVSFL